MTAELVGDQRQVGQRPSGDAAAAVVLRDEERRPAELGALLPVVTAEAGRVVPGRPQAGDRRLVLQVLPRRLREELLVGRELELHSSLLESVHTFVGTISFERVGQSPSKLDQAVGGAYWRGN